MYNWEFLFISALKLFNQTGHISMLSRIEKTTDQSRNHRGYPFLVSAAGMMGKLSLSVSAEIYMDCFLAALFLESP